MWRFPLPEVNDWLQVWLCLQEKLIAYLPYLLFQAVSPDKLKAGPSPCSLLPKVFESMGVRKDCRYRIFPTAWRLLPVPFHLWRQYFHIL